MLQAGVVGEGEAEFGAAFGIAGDALFEACDELAAEGFGLRGFDLRRLGEGVAEEGEGSAEQLAAALGELHAAGFGRFGALGLGLVGVGVGLGTEEHFEAALEGFDPTLQINPVLGGIDVECGECEFLFG